MRGAGDGAVERDVVERKAAQLSSEANIPAISSAMPRDPGRWRARRRGATAPTSSTRRASNISSFVNPCSAAMKLSGPVASVGGPSVMNVPAPWRACTTPIADSACSPARTDGRLTPICTASSRSGGSRSPGRSSPCSISARTCATTCSVVTRSRRPDGSPARRARRRQASAKSYRFRQLGHPGVMRCSVPETGVESGPWNMEDLWASTSGRAARGRSSSTRPAGWSARRRRSTFLSRRPVPDGPNRIPPTGGGRPARRCAARLRATRHRRRRHRGGRLLRADARFDTARRAGRDRPAGAALVRSTHQRRVHDDHRAHRRRSAHRADLEPGAHRLHAAQAALGAATRAGAAGRASVGAPAEGLRPLPADRRARHRRRRRVRHAALRRRAIGAGRRRSPARSTSISRCCRGRSNRRR